MVRTPGYIFGREGSFSCLEMLGVMKWQIIICPRESEFPNHLYFLIRDDRCLVPTKATNEFIHGNCAKTYDL